MISEILPCLCVCIERLVVLWKSFGFYCHIFFTESYKTMIQTRMHSENMHIGPKASAYFLIIHLSDHRKVVKSLHPNPQQEQKKVPPTLHLSD